MTATKKTVLFIVEGPSDKAALEKIFKSVYRRSKNIEFKFTSGDISSNFKAKPENVEKRLEQILTDFLNDKKLRQSDVFQIIELFDMDGAYIPETAVLPGETEKFCYTEESISCVEPDRVIKRNEIKKTVMDYLLTVKDVKGIPYEMYFLSRNLDHALYNCGSLNDDLKVEYADEFYEAFLGREYMFEEFLKTDVVNGVPDSYEESWAYIREGLHSLERHTNLHLYFTRHPVPDGLL